MVIKVGAPRLVIKVGGKNPISVQSMTNTLTTDVKATIKQINEINIVCRAFKEPANLLKSLENKISKKNKIILMVSEKKTLSASGFDIVYKESEASKILGKKRGFLEIQMS